MLERKNKRNARIGIFAVAHDTYWAQFPGLYENIMGYHKDAQKLINENDVEIIDYGMIDSSIKGYEALKKMQGDDLDVIFCNMVTYATSSVYAPIIRDLNVPMVLLALQPLEAMDCSKACTFMQLENDAICAVPEFICVANRLNRKIRDVIIGVLYDDEKVSAEIIIKNIKIRILRIFLSYSPKSFIRRHILTGISIQFKANLTV